MRDKGLSVQRRLSEVAVEADPVRLRQVVTKLLSNAAKFVPPGGTIRVDLAGGETWVSLQVADERPGLAPEDLPHVLERFFRGSHARAGGSGIGLAVVNELVEAHGGEVAVTSEPGGGATFTVRLPQRAQGVRRAFAGSSPGPRRLSSVGENHKEKRRSMKFAHTTRWVTAGAAFGLSTAVFAGIAYAATPGSAGHAAGSRPTGGVSAPALATTNAATTTATTSTTTAPPGGNAASGTQGPAGTSPMMSEMLAGLSPQARAEFQTLYPQMLQLMDSSQMMSGTGTAGSMMGQPTTGNGPASSQKPAS